MAFLAAVFILPAGTLFILSGLIVNAMQIQEFDEARKKFSNAKSLSSSQFFDQNKAVDVAAQATLSKFSGFPESSEAGEAEQQWCCALMQEHEFFFLFPQMEEPSGRTWFKPWCFSLCICGKGPQGLVNAV
ncbi:uncharacterized protein [Arachis hypogaea]|uniref:uncharacterized protein isoform X5 n=1 Tax=Arachis hypogaea TaxID=3818 RepID=UPI003B21644E